jgi:hypothetical protein
LSKCRDINYRKLSRLCSCRDCSDGNWLLGCTLGMIVGIPIGDLPGPLVGRFAIDSIGTISVRRNVLCNSDGCMIAFLLCCFVGKSNFVNGPKA